MKRKQLTPEEIEKRIQRIERRGTVKPTPEDLAAFERVAMEDPNEFISFEEIKKRFAEIDALEPEEPTAEDLAAIAAAEAEDPSETITLEEYKRSRSKN